MQVNVPGIVRLHFEWSKTIRAVQRQVKLTILLSWIGSLETILVEARPIIEAVIKVLRAITEHTKTLNVVYRELWRVIAAQIAFIE